jgi:phosphate transport system permease protein
MKALSHANRRRLSDKLLLWLTWFCSIITVAVLVWILSYILINGVAHINWSFLTTIYKPVKGLTGIFPMIISTLMIIGVTLVISTPVGICSAIYLVEYSKPGKLVAMIRFATETLAGIPSIIYGLFGFIFFVVALQLKYSILSGALTLSIMVLPTVIRATEEALKAVPDMYREGSLALGASKLKTISRVVLPCAIPGILTALILSIGRIVGETAAVYLTAGYAPNIPTSIMRSGQTLSVHLYTLAKEGISFEQAYATATVLVVIVAVLNFIATRVAGKLTKVAAGG